MVKQDRKISFKIIPRIAIENTERLTMLRPPNFSTNFWFPHWKVVTKIDFNRRNVNKHVWVTHWKGIWQILDPIERERPTIQSNRNVCMRLVLILVNMRHDVGKTAAKFRYSKKLFEYAHNNLWQWWVLRIYRKFLPCCDLVVLLKNRCRLSKKNSTSTSNDW